MGARRMDDEEQQSNESLVDAPDLRQSSVQPVNVLSVHVRNDRFASRPPPLDDDPAGILGGFPCAGALGDTPGSARIREGISHMLGVTSKKKCPDTEKAPLSALHISKSLEIELSDSPLIFDYSDEVFSRQIKPLIPKPAPIAAAGYTGSVHRALISKFRALETVIREMQHPKYGIRLKIYKRRFKTYDKVVSGQQIYDWIMQRKSGLDKEGIMEICSNMFDFSYILPMEYRDKFCADTTLYTFQTSSLWLSKISNTNEEDYIAHLLRRSMYSETKYILEEYEEYRLAAFRDRYTPEWSDVCGEAERINSNISKLGKDYRWRFLMQIHAFWCMHYPKDPVRVLRYLQELLIPKTHATPQKTSKLTSTINPNSEKNIRMSDFDVEKTLKPEELLSWYKRIIESYTYQLGTPRISPEESAKLIVQRVSAATPIDSFLSLAVGLKNAWISSVPTDTFCESSVPDQASLALWKLSFSELLRSPSGIKCFYDFLASEFSSENLSFLLECRELEKIFYYDAFLQKTISICNEFIVPGAPREINIVHSMRQKIIAHMEEGEAGKSKLPRNIFDDATTSVLRLMSTDSYVRFCSSKLFKGMSKIDINSD